MNLIQYWKEKNKQDFDAFVKTNTSVSQIQALTKLKEEAVEITTREFGQMEFVGIDAIDELISKIEGGNPIVENNKTIADYYIGHLIEEIVLLGCEKEHQNDLLKYFAKNLKAHIAAIMLSSGTITDENISHIKVILYHINRQLNDIFGLNEPLCAANQLLVEPELVDKYNLQEFINEVEA